MKEFFQLSGSRVVCAGYREGTTLYDLLVAVFDGPHNLACSPLINRAAPRSGGFHWLINILLERATDDRLEGGQAVHHAGVTQAVVREQRAEAALLAMQGQVVQYQGLYQ